MEREDEVVEGDSRRKPVVACGILLPDNWRVVKHSIRHEVRGEAYRRAAKLVAPSLLHACRRLRDSVTIHTKAINHRKVDSGARS